MQTSKITTFWTGEQVVAICEFLDELRNTIMTSHEAEINQYWAEVREEQLRQKSQHQTQVESEDWFDDPIPF